MSFTIRRSPVRGPQEPTYPGGVLLRTADASTPVLPPFDLGRIVTEAGIDPLATILTIWVAGAYLVGVRVLHARGDRWPLGRTISFVGVGMGAFAVATMSGIGAYDTTLLSVHMVQHMILTMVVPLALAMGAPVTLALRTLPARPRRWLLTVLHSLPVRVLSFPPLAFLMFVLSPWVLYFTGWYPASVESTYVHEMTHLHLVATGALFLWPLVGVDPVPGRVGYPFRMMLMVMTLPFHAFLGVTIMNQEELIAGEHYTGLDLAWLPDPMDDQHLAGGILWGTGDVVGLLFFMALFAQWVRSSMREAEREDRRLDRLERRERLAREGAE
jgi:cytochrome c oxidase assembly factor CtaG